MMAEILQIPTALNTDEQWAPHPLVRWAKEKPSEHTRFIGTFLEQLWVSNMGRQAWRTVPTFDYGTNAFEEPPK